MAYGGLVGRINEPIEAVKYSIHHALIPLESWIIEQKRPFSALLHRYGEVIHRVFLEEFRLDARRIICWRYGWIVVVNVGKRYADWICRFTRSLRKHHFEMAFNLDTPVVVTLKFVAVFTHLSGFGFTFQMSAAMGLGRAGIAIWQDGRHNRRTSVPVGTPLAFPLRSSAIADLLFAALMPWML